jgi:hypothetical protein
MKMIWTASSVKSVRVCDTKRPSPKVKLRGSRVMIACRRQEDRAAGGSVAARVLLIEVDWDHVVPVIKTMAHVTKRSIPDVMFISLSELGEQEALQQMSLSELGEQEALQQMSLSDLGEQEALQQMSLSELGEEEALPTCWLRMKQPVPVMDGSGSTEALLLPLGLQDVGTGS